MASIMSMLVIKKGTLDTFQDNGRTGWQHLGIPVGGYMDPVSAKLANLLVGNSPHEAVLEIFLPGPVLQFTANALIAITGAGSVVSSDGIDIEYNRPTVVGAGSSLSWLPTSVGRISYLAIRGGWQLTPWLGSFSTCPGVAQSGWLGRALQKNDAIPFRETLHLPFVPENASVRPLPWKHAVASDTKDPIRLMPDSQLSLLSQESLQHLTAIPFLLHPNSNRMSYSLMGCHLTGQRREMISSAVLWGSLQWLPEGQLQIFMADHPTTGGYPRIAQVAAADRGRLAQWSLQQPLFFDWITREKAEQILLEQHSYLTRLEKALHLRMVSYLTGSS